MVHVSRAGREGRREALVPADARVDDLVRQLAGDGSGPPADSAVLKVVGEDAYLLGSHRIGDYESVRERIASGKVCDPTFSANLGAEGSDQPGQVPHFLLVCAEEVDIERAVDGAYQSLESGGADPAPAGGGAPGLSGLHQDRPPVPSTGLGCPFALVVESLRLAPEASLAGGGFRWLGLEAGLFHGGWKPTVEEAKREKSFLAAQPCISSFSPP